MNAFGRFKGWRFTSVGPSEWNGRSRNGKRRGLALIEFLMVMIILGLLIALLIPLAGRLRERPRRTEILSEIQGLEEAVHRFRNRYGVFPPSRLQFKEDGSGYSDGPVAIRTEQYLRKIWPDFLVTTAVDFNGDGDTSDTARLNGSECLVFFLGGMPLPYVPDPSGVGVMLLSDARGIDPSFLFEDVTLEGMEGFCRNASFPFARSSDTMIPDHEIRTEIFFPFASKRLSDVDADGFWEYYPPNLLPPASDEDLQDKAAHELKGAFDPELQPHPYAYASGYDGAGYNMVLELDGEVRVTHDPAWGPLRSPLGLAWPLSRRLIDLDPTRPLEKLAPGFDPSTIEWWNPRSFQIIAPGLDGRIGRGVSASTSGIAAYDPYTGLSTVTDEMLDNLTNFSNVELSEIE